jgi:hypothetical protein
MPCDVYIWNVLGWNVYFEKFCTCTCYCRYQEVSACFCVLIEKLYKTTFLNDNIHRYIILMHFSVDLLNFKSYSYSGHCA